MYRKEPMDKKKNTEKVFLKQDRDGCDRLLLLGNIRLCLIKDTIFAYYVFGVLFFVIYVYDTNNLAFTVPGI